MIIYKNNQILGSLEADIMEVVWKLGNASVRQVLGKLNRKRRVAYTTVMTVMARLYVKGILSRRFDEAGAYIYTPIQDKITFLEHSSKKLIRNLISEFGEVAVAQFVDTVQRSSLKDLKKWRAMLRKIK